MDPQSVSAIALARVPDGVPAPADFALVQLPRSPLTEGQVRLAVRCLSLDPYQRSTLGGRHFGDAPVGPGDVPPGRSVGEVVESRCADVEVGRLVLAETGWRSEAVVPGADVSVVAVPPGVAVSAALGALGMPGLTAYAAHVRQLCPRAGETVVLGAATGGVGAVAGRLALRAGARVVGIVGSDDKAALATGRLGLTAAVRRGPGLDEALAQACPDGVDAYLHLGDQATLDVVMERLALGARVSLCGLMDQYNGGAPTRLRAGAVMTARAQVRGMVVYDHADLAAEHAEHVGALLTSGDLVALEDRYVGLAEAPVAFSRLMSGRNVGKVVVDLG
ncbi:NADP-dependent oxidoreductase [Nocardioides sp. cx-173]|uniref:MDR family NADP-dependent oxidoreductase n=1 Tax=Nocardioides sp. cx-173 TaxID=2898796 RepID=UPI001E3DD1A4|nr:NADP-dependent oxidoreductase [Nocardioides sp. cx-173]MCD4524361.1 NADP-dependent oxidoreductase [Nocardioides sp. cx-173]UGB43151.1 NADP-dependent oxidoreductase [Nocardioides sp. cx-173]